MKRIGIIGAGAIADAHIKAFKNNTGCTLVAIADINLELAKKRALEYGIEKVYGDYKELLSDAEIDAVSIVTPTFTHTGMVIDALTSGKDVLCEKPPALVADDVRKCEAAAKETGKLLMYAFVCRFRPQVKFLKDYIDSGKMGKIVSADAARIYRSMGFNGWFCDKTKSGGFLFDSAIHELDLMLYLMGYPKVKTVLGFTSNVNSDLPKRLGDKSARYESLDTVDYKRTMESFVCGMLTLENGATINIKGSSVLVSVNDGTYIDISGENSGAHMEPNNQGRELEMIEIGENGFNKFKPSFNELDPYCEEVDHFIDCITNGAECIAKPCEAVALVEILNAIYKSAEIGKAIEL